MRIFTVDAFADQPFAGNPAGVCLIEGAAADAGWMQSVAAEMNLAETAFLERRNDGRFGLRWFTPLVEVDLCGHATLASAHVLWEELGESAVPLVFDTRSGALTATRADDGGIRLDFPADPPVPVHAPDGLVAALGVEPIGVYRGVSDILVEVADVDTVRKLAPDLRALATLPARGVIVTALATGPTSIAIAWDFVSRCFYPAAGIDEDPVTGSAHCTLASFWCPRRGRPSLVGWQASARGGRVDVELAGDRVRLTGRAVTVLRGELA